MAALTTNGAFHHQSIEGAIIKALQDEGMIILSELQLLAGNSIKSIEAGKAHFATHPLGTAVSYARYLDPDAISHIDKQTPKGGLGYRLPLLSETQDKKLQEFLGDSYTVLMDAKAAENPKFLEFAFRAMEHATGNLDRISRLGRQYGLQLEPILTLGQLRSAPFEELSRDPSAVPYSFMHTMTYKAVAEPSKGLVRKIASS